MVNTGLPGQDAAGSGRLEGLNAGIKLIAAAGVSLASLLVIDTFTTTVICALELVALLLAGFRPVQVLIRLWPVLLAALLTTWSTAILAEKTGTLLFDVGLYSMSTGSLVTGAGMGVRTLALALASLAFILTTDPTDLGDSLAQTFRLPARFVLAALAALRLVGLLFTEWHTLGQARRARGLGTGQSLVGRIKTGVGQAFALLVQAIRRGTRLAITMEARGFGAGRRTWARTPAYSRADAGLLAVCALMVAVAYGASTGLGTIRFLWS